MSEAVHGFMTNAESLADEIVSQREARGEQFTQSTYAGLQSSANRLRMRHKYACCEYVKVSGGVARQLMASEVAELQRHVSRVIRSRSTGGEPMRRRGKRDRAVV